MVAQTIVIDWTPILWVGGIFVTIISGLLLWIGVLVKVDRNTIVARTDKHETWIIEQQKEMIELGKNMNLSIELVKSEQAHSKDRLDQFMKLVEDGRFGRRPRK